jgi:hypothetical protein
LEAEYKASIVSELIIHVGLSKAIETQPRFEPIWKSWQTLFNAGKVLASKRTRSDGQARKDANPSLRIIIVRSMFESRISHGDSSTPRTVSRFLEPVVTGRERARGARRERVSPCTTPKYSVKLW